MRIKLIIIVSFVLLVGYSLFVLMTGYPLVIRKSKFKEMNLGRIEEEFNPLAGFNFNDGKWTVYLIIDPSDFPKLSSKIEPYKLWKTESVTILQEMQLAWNFRPTGGDVATATSALIVVHDGVIVFESGLVVDKNLIGIQSEKFGWAEPTDTLEFLNSLSHLNRVWLPIAWI